MDKGAAACQDFYQYAVGGWLKANPIPADYPSWGAFNELNERNREALHQILERLAASPGPEGSDERKLGDFWSSCMDETAIEAQGAPAAPGRARAHRGDPEPLGPAGRDRAAPDLRGERRLPVRFRARPQGLRQRHRRGVPGRPRVARARLLHEDRQGVQGPARQVRRARGEDARSARREEGRGRRPRPDRPLLRNQAGPGIDDARRAARLDRHLQQDERAGPGEADAELFVERLLPRDRLTRRRPGQRGPAEVLPGPLQAADRLDTPGLEDVPALAARQRRRVLPVQGVRGSGLRLLLAHAPGNQTDPAALEALRVGNRQRDGRCARPHLRQGVLPAGVEGADGRARQEPHRGSARGLEDAALDGRGHAHGRAGKARRVHAQDRLPGQMARLLEARRHARDLTSTT